MTFFHSIHFCPLFQEWFFVSFVTTYCVMFLIVCHVTEFRPWITHFYRHYCNSISTVLDHPKLWIASVLAADSSKLYRSLKFLMAGGSLEDSANNLILLKAPLFSSVPHHPGRILCGINAPCRRTHTYNHGPDIQYPYWVTLAHTHNFISLFLCVMVPVLSSFSSSSKHTYTRLLPSWWIYV